MKTVTYTATFDKAYKELTNLIEYMLCYDLLKLQLYFNHKYKAKMTSNLRPKCMFTMTLTNILLKRAFSFGGNGLLGGILLKECKFSVYYFNNKLK